MWESEGRLGEWLGLAFCWRVGLWQGIWAIELDSQSGAGSRRARNSRLRSLFIKGWFSGLLHMAGQMVPWSKVPSQGAKWRLTPSLPPLHQAMHPPPGGGCLSNSKVPEPWQLGHQFVSLPDLLTAGTPWWHLYHPSVAPSPPLHLQQLKGSPCPSGYSFPSLL